MKQIYQIGHLVTIIASCYLVTIASCYLSVVREDKLSLIFFKSIVFKLATGVSTTLLFLNLMCL